MATLGLESRSPDFCSMRNKDFFFFPQARVISHSVRCLAFGSLAKKEKEKKLHIHISRERDICFTLVYGPFAGKINSIFATKGWVKDSVLFKSHSVNLKQDISSDCFKKNFLNLISHGKKYADDTGEF